MAKAPKETGGYSGLSNLLAGTPAPSSKKPPVPPPAPPMDQEETGEASVLSQVRDALQSALDIIDNAMSSESGEETPEETYD